MVRQILISLALLSFSIVSIAAAIPMDVDQTVVAATPNTVLHQDVMLVQGGGRDKEVADVRNTSVVNACFDAIRCTSAVVPAVMIDARLNLQRSGIGSVENGDASILQPLLVSLMIIVFIVFFLSRKSISTK